MKLTDGQNRVRTLTTAMTEIQTAACDYPLNAERYC